MERGELLELAKIPLQLREFGYRDNVPAIYVPGNVDKCPAVVRMLD